MALAAVLGIGLAAAPAGAASGPAEALLAEARADCASIDGGVFTTEGAPVTEIDLTGDGAPDEIVDQGAFRCT
ncbi:MAG: hypothetical protein RQ752_12720, partial [Thermohalobaculum sp.]|nr:hypothetical protein [Thermohalobaculum sp.]